MTTTTDMFVIGTYLQRELEAMGHAITHRGDHLVREEDGAQLGLASVMATCAREPRPRWRAIVADHARRIHDSPVRPDIMSTLTLDEARAGVHLRLQARDLLPWPEVMSYARPVGEDLVEIFQHKVNDALLQLTDEAVERLGPDQLRQIGLANLIASPLGTVRPHRLTGGGRVIVVRGASGFTASRALALPELLRRTVGNGETVPLPHGALVSLPDRHTLGVHVVGHPDVWMAALWLLSLGQDDYHSAAYPLTPHLHWWRDGELRTVSGPSTPHHPGPLAGGELTDVLEAVAGGTLAEAVRRRVRQDRARRRR